ncbi:hypothetical protein I3842_05G241300 [Carya illinoinensis]|uniref:Uncharacterized protein n=1 Tax=Carya illinoinensis TaxID=32201 RepID=A0A922F8F9_CARIL|nr:hypothetical protein I3842_05G241300 [Carya illinoinensis]
MVTRVVFLLFFLLLATALKGQCIRSPKETRWFKSRFQSQLPRGPVPPSGPSPCHNKLSPFKHTDSSFPNDYIICP